MVRSLERSLWRILRKWLFSQKENAGMQIWEQPSNIWGIVYENLGVTWTCWETHIPIEIDAAFSIFLYIKAFKIPHTEFGPGLVLLGIYLKEVIFLQCFFFFTDVLFTIWKSERQPKCLKVRIRFPTLGYSHVMEYMATIKNMSSKSI